MEYDPRDNEYFARTRISLLMEGKMLNVRKPIDNRAVGMGLRSHLMDWEVSYRDEDEDCTMPITEDRYSKRHQLFLKAIRGNPKLRVSDEEIAELPRYTRILMEGFLSLGELNEKEEL